MKTKPTKREQWIEREWCAWQRLCRALSDAGAVTKSDLVTARNVVDSPGTMLLATIRAWGAIMQEGQQP